MSRYKTYHYFNHLIFILVGVILIQSCRTSKNSSQLVMGNTPNTSFVKVGENDTMKIPGQWNLSSKNILTNQYFFKNQDSIVISLSKNPVSKFPFHRIAMEDSLFVNEYYRWESDHYKEQGYIVKKIDDSKLKDYVVWTIEDKSLKVSLLYGVKKDKAYGLSMIDPRQLSLKQQTAFLIQVFKDN